MGRTSAQRKFEWGVERMEALCAEVKAFEGGNAYMVETRKKVHSASEVRYSFHATCRKPMPDHWPLVIGDVVHNFRSALEHAVYAAAGGRGKTQFPIFSDECEFEVKGRPMISGVKPPIRAIIEAAQPFKATGLPPHTDALAVLADLSNADKHREISTTAVYLELPWLSHDGDIGEMTDATAALGAVLPPDEETEVLAFTLHGPKASEMDVYPGVSYEVRMSRVRVVKKSNGSSQRVTDNVALRNTLENVARRIAVVIRSVETGQPLPVWLVPAI